jgi:hypothetical protein
MLGGHARSLAAKVCGQVPRGQARHRGLRCKVVVRWELKGMVPTQGGDTGDTSQVDVSFITTGPEDPALMNLYN